jgi:hypothetical protein
MGPGSCSKDELWNMTFHFPSSVLELHTPFSVEWDEEAKWRYSEQKTMVKKASWPVSWFHHSRIRVQGLRKTAVKLADNPDEIWTWVPPGYGTGIAQWHSARLDDRGFESRQGLGIFLFTTASRPVLGPTQHPIQWVPGFFPWG